jgi:carbamoyl-phosphate synthase large subunit
VHSGDSIAIYPPQTLSSKVKETVADYTVRLAKALKVVGLFNIQFVMDKDEKVYVIEVNPRASRTIPVMSKITGIPMVTVATRVIMGQTLAELGYKHGVAPESDYIAVKAPVFSFSKLTTVDTFLGPEMKSTGEVMGVGKDFHSALYKAFTASGFAIPSGGNVLLSVADRDREECVGIAHKLLDLGFKLFATVNTHSHLASAGIDVEFVPDDNVLDYIKDDKISLVINTPTKGKIPERQGFNIRRTSMEYNTPCMTSLDTTNAMLQVLEQIISNKNETDVYALDQYSVRKENM